MPDRDVIVVGGGIGGLVVAVHLARRGMSTLLLEAGPEPGGCVRFHTVGGLRLDRGADSFATARPAVSDLAAGLGLPVQRPGGGAAWVRHEAGSAPLPAGAMLGIPSRPWATDVRAIVGWPGAVRAAVDRLLPGRWTGGPAVGLGELVRRRMGARVLRRLVEPVVGGVYSADPSGLDVDTVAPGLRAALTETGSLSGAVAGLRGAAPPAGSAVAGLVGGMGTLTDALVAALRKAGCEVRCGSPVRRVARSGDGWAVTVAPGPGSPDTPAAAIRASAAVLATPAGTTRALLGDATGGALTLPPAPASAVVLATLVLDEPGLDGAPRGSGMLVAPRVTGVTAKALTHATAKWAYLAEAAGPGRHVLRLSYGRGGDIPPETAFPELALADASDLLGVRLDRRRVIDHALVRYPDQLAAPRSGRASEVAWMREGLGSWPGLSVTGSAVAGTGLAAVVADATATAAAVAPER